MNSWVDALGEPVVSALEDGEGCRLPGSRRRPRPRLPSGPRERAARGGVGSVSDEELVALLLGTGCRGAPVLELAGSVLRDVGGLLGLARAGAGRLAAIRGLGEAKAWRLAAAIELGRRQTVRAAASRLSLSTPAAVARAFTARIGALEHEQLWVVALDGRNRVRGVRKVAQGGRHGLVVTAREVLSAALSEAASAFLLVHNHPSGAAIPSAEDIEMTRAIAAAADIVGVPLLDHVIVTAAEHAYCSLLDDGLLSPSRSL